MPPDARPELSPGGRSALASLVERAMARPGHAGLEPVVTKEILHYDMLHALAQERLLAGLVFQGGTALRLCHRSERLSEDLDFAGGADFDGSGLGPIKQALERHVGARYGLDVRVKEPGEPRPSDSGVRVARWTLSVETEPDRPDLPRQRIKLEIANVPAYTGVPTSLRVNYEGLPDGYADTLVTVESAAEIASDKVKSLVGSVERPRYRDLWDLGHLARRGAEPDPELVRRKILDYGETGFEAKLVATFERLPEWIRGGALEAEMRRFLPDAVRERTLDRGGFPEALERTVREQLEIGTRFG